MRAEHHICGVLTGTLPHVSQQNVFLGPPLILLPEEVVLLVKKRATAFPIISRNIIDMLIIGYVVIVDDPLAHRPPSSSHLRKWNNDRLISLQTQTATSITKESKKPKTLSEAALRKRKEREEKRAAAAAKAKAFAEGDLESTQDGLFTPTPSTPVVEQRPATPVTTIDLLESLYTVTIPASSPEALPWYSSQGAVYDTLKTAKEAGIWTYPNDLHEQAKCGVFEDLWEKGYYMGGGIKFGGDFLVYPGTSTVPSPTSSY